MDCPVALSSFGHKPPAGEHVKSRSIVTIQNQCIRSKFRASAMK